MLAGALTTLSPCVLPVLPIVLVGAMNEHRFGPVAFAAGVATTFAALGIALTGAGWSVDVDGGDIKKGAAILIALFAVVLMSPALQQRLAAAGAPLTERLNGTLAGFNAAGLTGQFGLGALMGAVWTPCSGPTLGAAATLAASGESVLKAGIIMLFFAVGACTPLMAIAYGSRRTLGARRDAMRRFAGIAKPALGAILLLVAFALLTGLDRSVEAAAVDSMPEWLVRLTTRF